MRARVLLGHRGWQLVERERKAGRLAVGGKGGARNHQHTQRRLIDLGLNDRKADYWRRFHELIEKRLLSNREHVHALPCSWGTLYELTKLPAMELGQALSVEGAVG